MESRLSSSDIQLLDRLYNLRGEDSVVIKAIETKKTEISNGKIEKEERMANLETEISTLDSEKKNLKEQTDRFVEDFKGFDRETYELVLGKLNIAFDPQAMVTQVQEKAPAEISSIEETLGEKTEELSSLKAEIKDAEALLQQSEQELFDARTTQDSLNKLIEELFQGNQNITKQQIFDLFSKLEFTDEEINNMGRILLFSNELIDYEEDIKARRQAEESGKNIGQIMLEAQAQADVEVEIQEPEEEPVVEEQQPAEEIVEEEPAVEEQPVEDESVPTEEEPEEVSAEDLIAGLIQEEIDVQEQSGDLEESFEPIAEEPVVEEEHVEDSIIEQLGIETDGLTDEEIELIKNGDPIVVTTNMRILSDLGIETKNHANALIDRELSEKVDLLQNNNKKGQDIKYHIDFIADTPLDELQARISKLESVGLNISELSLDVLNHTDGYIANMESFNNNGITLDQNEVVKHSSSMASTDVEICQRNLSVAAEYDVVWKKPNGKTAYEGIAQSTKSLITKIDQYVEAGEEDVLRIGAELLAKDAETVLSNIVTLNSYGTSYKTEEKYRPYVADEERLSEVFSDPTMMLSVPTAEENNDVLRTILDTPACVDIIINALDTPEYYSETNDADHEITLSTLEQIVEGISTQTTKYVFTIENVQFSINKFRRNILCLLSKGIGATNNDMILSSLATNSNKTEDEIKRVAQALGFNVAMGGR